MKLDREFLSSPAGLLVLLGTLCVLLLVGVRWRSAKTASLPAAKASRVAALPKTFVREGARFPKTVSSTPAPSAPAPEAPTPSPKPRTLALSLFAAERRPAEAPVGSVAPYGRLIPCETVFALESNRLETPVIGLVTRDVWHAGRLVVPAGAEVHGKAALDRVRERLAAQGAWRIVWRTLNADNGTEIAVNGLALDREIEPETEAWGERDGSAGLGGTIVKTQDDRELKLFAATFLASATAALQDTRAAAGILGEAALPVATVRNATLAGTGAVLREYAQSMREAIARDGFFVRVPAGKQFYLYITETINRSQGRRAGESAATHP